MGKYCYRDSNDGFNCNENVDDCDHDDNENNDCGEGTKMRRK